MNLGTPADPTEDHKQLLRLLQRVHTYSPTTKSDRAREYADEIAGACSMGFITTLVVPGGSLHGHRWKMTVLGMSYLEHWAEDIEPEEERKFLDEEDAGIE